MFHASNPRVLTVVLNTTIDTTLILSTPLTTGFTHKALDVHKLPGGGGLNVARVLRTLGVTVRATGLVGGPATNFIHHGLAREGIEAVWQPIAGETRTCTVVIEKTMSRVTEVNEPGPTITGVEAQDFLDLFATLLEDVSFVVLSGSLPPGLPDNYYAQLIERAHASGIMSVLDTSCEALFAGLPARPFLMKSNMHEAAHFLGRPLTSITDAVDAGQRMREQGAQMVVITLGAEGAVLVTGVGAFHARLHVPEAISTVGCGDAFVAGFVAGLLPSYASPSMVTATIQPEQVMHAFRLATACGAANTLSLGAGIVDPADVRRLEEQVNLTQLQFAC